MNAYVSCISSVANDILESKLVTHDILRPRDIDWMDAFCKRGTPVCSDAHKQHESLFPATQCCLSMPEAVDASLNEFVLCGKG